MATGFVWFALIMETIMCIALISCVVNLTKRYKRDQGMIQRLESKVAYFNSIINELRDMVLETDELESYNQKGDRE